MDSLAGMVLKRIGLGFLTLIVISILIFVGVEALPGDFTEAVLGQNALPETVEAFRRELSFISLPMFVISHGSAVFCGAILETPLPMVDPLLI